MGLFAVPKNQSPEELVEAAIGNLNLWKDWGQPDYLLENFALGCILGAMGLGTDQVQKVRGVISDLRKENSKRSK